MKLHRFEYINPDSINELNGMLVRGWHPVREIPASGPSANGGDCPSANDALVLLEKESDFPQFPGATIDGNISVDALRDSPLFTGMTMQELRQVVAQSEVLVYEANDVIFQVGDEPDAIYVVIDGEVQITIPDLPIEEPEIIALTAGGVFGESTFFAPAPHSVAAECLTDVTLLSIGRTALDEFLQARHPVAMALAVNSARLLASRLQETDRWVHDLLENEQSAQIAASWRRYRHGVRTAFQPSRGFIGI